MCNSHNCSCGDNHTHEHVHQHREIVKEDLANLYKSQESLNKLSKFNENTITNLRDETVDWLNSFYSGEVSEKDFILANADFKVKNGKFDSEEKAEDAILMELRNRKDVSIVDIIIEYLLEKQEFIAK